jgi:hypothetical protein
MTFTNDELILALISLVRATRPSMLKQEADGFSVDFESLQGKKNLDDDERLLIKMRTVLESPAESATEAQLLSMDLNIKERHRLTGTLKRLEALQPWPDDVLSMSRDIRSRLDATL